VDDCRNTLEKIVESEMKMSALEETSTSKNKRGKGSSKNFFFVIIVKSKILKGP
jgi:hypothetical protein